MAGIILFTSFSVPFGCYQNVKSVSIAPILTAATIPPGILEVNLSDDFLHFIVFLLSFCYYKIHKHSPNPQFKWAI